MACLTCVYSLQHHNCTMHCRQHKTCLPRCQRNIRSLGDSQQYNGCTSYSLEYNTCLGNHPLVNRSGHPLVTLALHTCVKQITEGEQGSPPCVCSRPATSFWVCVSRSPDTFRLKACIVIIFFLFVPWHMPVRICLNFSRCPMPLLSSFQDAYLCVCLDMKKLKNISRRQSRP